ncbi:MAG TPA: helix-turn-helix domain-containing protein [Steroidobacteraceae bacterium]|nr:helix-turn-helix domain-containing protein [Steroidobacteraceae bacterium]
MPKSPKPGAAKANGRYRIPPRPAAPIDPVGRYDFRETTAYLRVGKSSVYKLFESGALEFEKVGKRVFVRGSSLIRYLTA